MKESPAEMIQALKDADFTIEENAVQEEKEKKKTHAEILLEILESLNIHLFHNEKVEPYARIYIDTHFEIWPLNGKQFKRYCQKLFYETCERPISPDAVKQAIGVLEGKAVFAGEKKELHNRVASEKDCIYIDLSNELWQEIEITKDGWKKVDNPSVKFKRYSHQSSNVIPEIGGNINTILQYINLKPGQELLFIVYLVCCFIPDIGHPIVLVHGEKGSGKTSFFKLIKKVVDPSIVETVTFPKDIAELVQKLSHHWWCGFDNLSYISDTISDTLCRAVTGDGFSKRQLFTDDDDVIYHFKRCIGLNGINVVATRDDLLDRCLMFELERISPEKRQEELKLWKQFEADRPYILGSIFDVLSKAMNIYPKVKLDRLYRLADFTRWGYAVAEAISKGNGVEFLALYESNIKRQNDEAIQSNPVAQCVVEFMKNRTKWEGSASNLLSDLEDVAERLHINVRERSFPKRPDQLSRQLNRLKSNLDEYGISYFNKRTKYGSMITLSYNKENDNTPVTPLHQPSSNACLRGDAWVTSNKKGDANGDAKNDTNSLIDTNDAGDDKTFNLMEGVL